MNIREFESLRPGDTVYYNGVNRTVATVHTWHDKVHTVEYEEGDNTKIDDPMLPDIVITSRNKNEDHPVVMTEVSFIVSGISPGVKGWGMMTDRMGEIVDEYGGEVHEIDVTPGG